MHANCQMLFKKYVPQLITPNCRVLEIGPDSSPSGLRKEITTDVATWDTADFPGQFANTYLLHEENKFPIQSAHYDIVISSSVLEHVRKPWVWLKEVVRVCRPGGFVVTIVPVSWPFHEAPIDCWRVYPDGIKSLYEEVGLEVVTTACESLEAGAHRPLLPGRSRWHQPLSLRLAYRFFNLFGFPMEYAFDTIGIGRKLN